MLNIFWTRWKREYLQSLQLRRKWNVKRRNLCIGDIVLVCDENLPRNAWLLARVHELIPSKDGVVRKVKIAIGDRNLDKKGKRNKELSIFERPIHKLLLLLEDTGEIPTEEPKDVKVN